MKNELNIRPYPFPMTYLVIEEASEALELVTEDLEEAIDYAESKQGKYLVCRNDEEHSVVWDTKPDVTYKI